MALADFAAAPFSLLTKYDIIIYFNACNIAITLPIFASNEILAYTAPKDRL